MLAASASLDRATQRKLTRLLRASPVLRKAALPLPVVRPAPDDAAVEAAEAATAATGAVPAAPPGAGASEAAVRAGGARATMVPAEIRHFTVAPWFRPSPPLCPPPLKIAL